MGDTSLLCSLVVLRHYLATLMSFWGGGYPYHYFLVLIIYIEMNNESSSTFLRKAKIILGKIFRLPVVIYQIWLDGVVIKLFPSPENAICSAVKLPLITPERVIANYYQGAVLFGKTNSEQLVWKIFPERAVITAETAHIPKRLKGIMRKQLFEIRYDTDFTGVIRACKRDDTWINEPLINIYGVLFDKGCVDTIEIYQEGRLVGGIWGLVISRTFAIMSMFHCVNHAGAIALATLVNHLSEGKYYMVDCGLINSNFKRYGATTISYEDFVVRLAQAHFRKS